MFGMSLVGLAVRGAIVLAVVGAMYAVYRSVDSAIGHHYADPVRLEMQAKVDAEKERADRAERANATLKASIGAVKEEVDSCNLRVDKLVKDQVDGILASTKARADIMAKWAKDQDRIAGLIAIATGPPAEGDFCEQARVADRILSDLARRQRLRHSGTAK